jgi:hypothetical protein
LQALADHAGLIGWDVSVDSTIMRAHQHAAGARHAPASEDLKRGSHTRKMRHWEQAAAG